MERKVRRAFVLAMAPIAPFLLIIFTCACRGPRDPIMKLLERMERAAEKRDASALIAHLSPDFRGPQASTRADAEALLKRYLAAYETVRLEIYEVVVQRADSTAALRFRVDFVGQALQFGGLSSFLPPSAMYRFKMDLARAGDEWKVTGAEWEDLGLPVNATPR
jgi:hypothetical protein